jgi:hypothetical protein
MPVASPDGLIESQLAFGVAAHVSSDPKGPPFTTVSRWLPLALENERVGLLKLSTATKELDAGVTVTVTVFPAPPPAPVQTIV